jgi:hypothetical protein
MASSLAYLAVFDLIGVAMCFFFDVMAPFVRGTSTALFYAIWLVLGIFCGILSYDTSGSFASPDSKGDWKNRADASKTGLLVILMSSVILAALSISFYLLLWRRQPASSVYVPDSASLTLTFFVAVLASVIFAHRSLGPEPKKKS